MGLMLKESNCPFWLLALDKNDKHILGSDGSSPCYYKSLNKQKELAKQMLKGYGKRAMSIYLLSDVAWDHMVGSWDAKETTAYIKGKGKLIMTRDELNEGEYPKGVSLELLPKEGAKVYTSVATSLEAKNDNKGLELKDENDKIEESVPVSAILSGIVYAVDNWDTLKDMIETIKDISNDIYSKAMDVYSALKNAKADIKEAAKEIGNILSGDTITESIVNESDNSNAAKEEFNNLIDNFKSSDIVKKEVKDNTYFAKIDYKDSYKSFLDTIVKDYEHQDHPSGLAEYYKKTDFGNISIFINYNKDANPAENGWEKDIETIDIQVNGSEKINESTLKESKDLNKVIDKAIKVLQKEDDEPRLKLINDLAKMDKYDITQDESKKISKILKDGEKESNTDKCIDKLKKLKESKIVQPVGNPQIANAFVNIDVDLDHMEVSDFIVRLSQAIRSEEQAILEYTALRSANGITNEDRSVIDAIIEEEKNHMVSITSLLYKQMLLNHSQNVDKAREEFTLPTFGQQDVMDEDNKLTESLSNIIGKILKEDNITTPEHLIAELKTDTNFDQIAHHIHAFSKSNMDLSNKLMDKLFDLEKADKSISDARNELIKMIEKESPKKVTEDINFDVNDSGMSKTVYNVEADVSYDEDFVLKVAENVKRAINGYNGTTRQDNYGADPETVNVGDGKLKLSVLTFNGFTDIVDNKFLQEYLTIICKQASNYEYFIELK